MELRSLVSRGLALLRGAEAPPAGEAPPLPPEPVPAPVIPGRLDNPPARPLSTGHFRKVAVNGFGDGHNSYAWGATWFKNHAFFGTNRDMLVMLKRRFPYEVPVPFWPVALPPDNELDLGGEIWRYDLDRHEWKRVYKPPIVEGIDGRPVALAYGFRNMAVYQGKSDAAPCIYTIPSCGSYGKGPVLLRSEDGEHFAQASEPGLELEDKDVTSYRGVLPFKGKLFITPSGRRGGLCNVSLNAVVLCSTDPVRGGWQASNPSSFGDPTNQGIFDIGVTDDFLYAATINVRHGTQLWKTDGEGDPPHRWTLVADRGFDRGPHNEMVLSFAHLRGCLYVGTGIQNGGFDRINSVGPAPAEIIRVYPDDTWEICIGNPRLTRFGPKFPLSGISAGFDNPFTGYIWRLCAHDGALYAGTFDSGIFLNYADQNEWSDNVRSVLTPGLLEQYLQTRGGCELWRTIDGEHWVPVTINGFGNRFNYGVRAFCSTPRGLFVGTANPFGPYIAVNGVEGWHYEDNPLGGLEVWHGCPEHAGSAGGDAPIRLTSPSAGAANLDPFSVPEPPAILAATLGTGVEGSDDGFYARQLELAEQELDEPAKKEVKPLHSLGKFEAGQAQRLQQDPVFRLAEQDDDLDERKRTAAERAAEYFNQSPIQNAGYWAATTLRGQGADEQIVPDTPERAARHVIRELLRTLSAADPSTAPLDAVIIGRGAAEIGHVIQQQRPFRTLLPLEPGEVRLQEPVRKLIPVADGSQHVLLWIEGPSRESRTAALKEAARVLRPGGWLLAADLLAPRPADAGAFVRQLTAEVLRPEYVRDLSDAGFGEPLILDITRDGWLRFCSHSRRHFQTRELLHDVTPEDREEVLKLLPGGDPLPDLHWLVRARKSVPPSPESGAETAASAASEGK